MDPRGLLRLGVVLLLATPLQAQLSFDNFDTYAAGSTIAGQGDWQTWDQNPAVDAFVSNAFANSAPNSLELQPFDDIVRLFNGINSGSFVFTSQVYIPSGQAGTYYFILLNTYNVGGPYNWSAQIQISDATGLVTDVGGSQAVTGTSATVPILYDTWVEVRVVVDLTTDSYDAFYNNQPIMTGNTWTGGVGASQLRCLDLYNDGGGTFYYDDVSVDCLGGCGACLPFDSMQCDIDCNTNNVTLDWTTFQVGGYANGIQVLRNGTLIASLPGTATTYSDIGAPLGLLEYEVVGDCGGQTWSSLCSVACTGACPPAVPGDECCDAIPAVAGANAYDDTGATESPDAYNDSLCGGTFLGDMIGDLWFTYTVANDGFLRVDTCAGAVDTDLVIYEGACGLGTIVACSGDAGGVCGLSSDVTIPTLAGTSYLIRVGRWGAAVVGGPGTLTITEICEPDFTGLATSVDCTSTDVELTWDAATFASFDVLRDGVAVATGLPAGTNAYTDVSVGNGTYSYEVVASCPSGASLSQQVDVTVAAALGVTDIIFRGEAIGGSVDSVLALDNALQAAGFVPTIIDASVDNVVNLPCLDDPTLERVWVACGSFPNNRALSAADGVALTTLQANGVHIYLESGDTWGFDPPTAFADIDGVADGTDDGDDSFLSMTGSDTTYGLDTSDLVGISYYQDAQAGNDWTDQLNLSTTDSLGPDSAVLWSEASGAYNTGVFYSTNAGGKVICTSWEFGGFGLDPLDPFASDPLRNDLMLRYLGAFAGGPPPGGGFIRGDANADGSQNIADAIYILSVLFPTGTPPTPQCDSALDANDDGGLNIADAISLLGVLFPSTTPAPTIPEPASACGPDPTADGLSCGPFAPCP